MIEIRAFKEADWPAVWALIEPVFRAGETYVFAPDTTREEAHHVWIEMPAAVFVAHDEHEAILGTYYIKANQPGLGAHVCNCGYIVAESARGKGIASQMCRHSQHEAVQRGYRAMQYNLVVSTNVGAVRLWERHGFDVVGRLPEAFHHPQHGYVDALVMYKLLDK